MQYNIIVVYIIIKFMLPFASSGFSIAMLLNSTCNDAINRAVDGFRDTLN